jgi:hypothetical protein
MGQDRESAASQPIVETSETLMLILYTTEDRESQIKLRAEDETVWLAQLELAELFDAAKQNISLHLKTLLRTRNSARIQLARIP